MALEPVGPGAGIVVLKGSHKWGRTFMPESFAGAGPKAEPQGPYECTPDFARELERHVPVEYSLEPGDCLVFDAFTVHGAASDLPAKRGSRRLTMRFAEGDAVFDVVDGSPVNAVNSVELVFSPPFAVRLSRVAARP